MAIAQDTFNETPEKGFPGMIANGELRNSVSRTVADAAGLAFGAPAFRNGTDGQVTATPAADTFVGFAIAHHGVQPLPGGVAADIYPQYESAGLITQGAIFVTVTGAVDEGDALTVGFGASAADGVGNTVADATHAATGWVADETLAGSGLCRVARR